MANEGRVTVVIPTRDRADTLVHTIRSAQAQDYEDLEILVSDNASADDTRELVAGMKDSRITYVNTGKRVSMSHNWEFALEHVKSGWITILGDDDALCPGALRRVGEIIEENGVLAIRSNGASFEWPSLRDGRYGQLSMTFRRGHRRIRSASALRRVLDGELHYSHLPMLYNGGFVHTSLIEKAKAVTGRFFRSMTPDVYSAMVFSLLTEEYVYSYEALAINGASHHSGGTAAFEKRKRARSYDPAAKFYAEENIPPHEEMPLFVNGRPVRSLQAVVYEAYLQARPFHDPGSPTMTAEEQLEVILRNAGDIEELRDWAEQYSDQHGIDFGQVIRRVGPKGRSWEGMRRRVAGMLAGARVFRLAGGPRIPLRNVYEASVVAGTLDRYRPGVVRRLTNLVDRLVRRIGSSA